MRWRLLLLVGVLVVVGLAIWFSFAGDAADRQGPAVEAGASGTPSSGSGRGGVGARETQSAEDRVMGRVTDEDGQPVEGGSLILACLDSDPPGRLLP